MAGQGHHVTLTMRWIYAQSLYGDNGATLDGLREAVTTLEETARISRRVLGNSHPVTVGIEGSLKRSRAMLRAVEECVNETSNNENFSSHQPASL